MTNRRHRRAVLWLAVGFVLVELGLAVAVDGWLREVRDPEFVAKECRLRERLAELPGRPLVLMLGSSRTVNGLHAGSLSGTVADDRPVVFNFGLPGGGPFLQRVCYERLRAAGFKPDLLLVEVVPAFFNHQLPEYLDQFMLDGARLSAAELALLAPYAELPRRPLSRWLHGRALPAHRHQAELHAGLGLDVYRPGFGPPAPDASMDAHGWQPVVGVPTPGGRRTATSLAHKQYDPFYRAYRPADGPIRALQDLLACCRADGIRAALVLMPESAEFRSHYSPEARTGLEAFLASLRQTAPLIDARAWVPDDGFADGHHMHPGGAAVFTARLGTFFSSGQWIVDSGQ